MITMKEKSTVSRNLRKYLTRYAPNSLLRHVVLKLFRTVRDTDCQ